MGKPLTQPLMMRRDYGDEHEEEQEKKASMMKKIPPIDYDDIEVKKDEIKRRGCLRDYDNPIRCSKNCLMCER